MSYSQIYRTLFDLQVLHEYYLNSGSNSFRGMDAKQQRLMSKNYSFNSFLQVIPTVQTRQILDNQKLLLRTNSNGLKVLAQVEQTAANEAAKPFISIDNNLELHFLVKIGDPAFEIYTDLTLVKNEIFYFSDIKPSGVPIDFPVLPIASDQESDPNYISNAYRLDEIISKNVIEEMQISPEDQLGLLGVVVLRMHGDPHQITDNDGKVPADPITFVMEFANRSTIWKYYFQNSDYYAETTSPKPLTRNGYIVIDPSQLTLRNKDSELPAEEYEFDLAPHYYPAPDVQKAEIEAGNFYSVIYI
jgi:hypothetical protein